MKIAKVLSGSVEGDEPLYAIVAIEFETTCCSACGELFLPGAPALFRVDRDGSRLDHPACRTRLDVLASDADDAAQAPELWP